ncbi:MAG: 3-keto-disaccharide hydrolase [Cyclobacteriaceae bacterium]
MIPQLFTLLFLTFLSVSGTCQSNNPKLEPIFNGKDLQGWAVPENNVWWIVEDGILYAKSDPEQKGSILWTENQYQDFVFQVDFRFGEGTVDSGVFLRTESEQLQIGESGSLKRDMTASPYISGKGYPVEAEGVKELLKMNDWNNIKVKVEGDTYTSWLNGKQVMTYNSETAVDKGAIGLQVHPNRDMSIDFRNLLFAEINN